VASVDVSVRLGYRMAVPSRTMFRGAVLGVGGIASLAAGCTTSVVQVEAKPDASSIALTDAMTRNSTSPTGRLDATPTGADAVSSPDLDAASNASVSDSMATAPDVDAVPVAPWANWPMPNPPSTGLPHPQVYDTSMSGIVRDTVTGLQWQAAVDGVARTWADALAYCAALPDFGGGWRLPSRIELVSIVDYTTMPAISAGAFGSIPILDSGTLQFWTASGKAGNPAMAWAIDFGTGVNFASPSAVTSPLLTRCVRGD
jgi:hypothetical protein